MYLIFLYTVNKFHKDILSFERPTSIIAFGRISAKLCSMFKEPPILEYSGSIDVTDISNAHCSLAIRKIGHD